VLLNQGSLTPVNLFFTQGSHWAVRENRRWKLLFDGSKKLFNMEKDIGETTDLAAANPDIVNRLTTAFQAWKVKLLAESNMIDFAGLDGIPLCFPDESFGEGLPG
jgi:hypothetical protein